MFGPIELTEKIEKLVCKGRSRKYYRFRPARFYGGIASADCVGCNLRCVFCWSNDAARDGKIGRFFDGEEVAGKLTEIARRHNFTKVRITGNEPTLCKEHLLDVLHHLPDDLHFILETNGIALGYDIGFVSELSNFDNLHIRVSLKGCDEAEFSKLTGANPEAFELQLKGLENCVKHNISCHAALLYDLIDKRKIPRLKERLRGIKIGLERIEFEYLMLYPHVEERLREASFSERPVKS
ncbi:MAG: molybdenum cofactor biosynthesis protein MoaA [Thermoplasmata archaeon]|nr:MAG: molybdenum cofactor biosynthesis protein MoaA [Thermoplasmata archaeon]